MIGPNGFFSTLMVHYLILFRVTAAIAGKAARAWWRRLPLERRANLRSAQLKKLANLHCIGISINREAVKKHQGKVGVVCGLSLVGAYQGYASHVLECPGKISIGMECVPKIAGFLLLNDKF